MAPPISPVADLRAALDRLAEAVEAPAFRLPSAAVAERLKNRQDTIRLLREYLISRLGDLSAPMLVAVFGPTGSGKSTIINALAGREVSKTGVVRPTTRAPVVWCRPGVADRYSSGPFVGAVVVEDENPLLEALTVVDTPDLDSYADENRRSAERILSVADAGIFVTTPQRYADAVPWEVVCRLTARRLPVTYLMNRMVRRSAGSLTDFLGMLRKEGLGVPAKNDVVVIHELHRVPSVLPGAAVKGLNAVVADMVLHQEDLVFQTIDGAIDGTTQSSAVIAADVILQEEDAQALKLAVDTAYTGQIEEMKAFLGHGALIRSEVVDRWQRLVGVSDLAALVGRGAGRLRDMVRPRQVAPVLSGEVSDEMVAMVVNRAQRAVNAVVVAWGMDPSRSAILTADLRSVGSDTHDLARTEIEGWLMGLVDLVRGEGKGRFQLARAASVGVNAAASILLVSVFAATGGFTGAEVGVVAGTAAAQQTILEHLFGRAAASRLAQTARSNLESRLGRVLEEDASRFRRAVDAKTDPLSIAADIEAAMVTVTARAREWAGARSS